MSNPRTTLISLMRGFFICPIISFLLKNDLIKIFLKKEFTVKNFKKLKNKPNLSKVLSYLLNLNLIKYTNQKKNRFKSTILGKKIFLRAGTFSILHSYKPYIDNLDNLLTYNQKFNYKCDRKENIIGSGSIHKKKFFPEAFKLIKKKEIGLIVDIGCGDGNYLIEINKMFKNVPILASDVSHIAVKEAAHNLKKLKCKKKFLVCDAFDVKKWGTEANNFNIDKNKKILVSLWFILHEISKGKTKKIITFFKNLKTFLPRSQILIGEISKLPSESLTKYVDSSIMPEFLFFHELSGQGVLEYKDYKKIQKQIPQKLDHDIKFDLVKYKNQKIPSAFIWSLNNY